MTRLKTAARETKRSVDGKKFDALRDDPNNGCEGD